MSHRTSARPALHDCHYDRRGRGDSGDTLPYAIDREIEDLAALIDEVGDPVHLYGHSEALLRVARPAAMAAELRLDARSNVTRRAKSADWDIEALRILRIVPR